MADTSPESGSQMNPKQFTLIYSKAQEKLLESNQGASKDYCQRNELNSKLLNYNNG